MIDVAAAVYFTFNVDIVDNVSYFCMVQFWKKKEKVCALE